MNARVSAEEAYRKVARVSDWWNQRSTGNTQKVGDTFKVNFGDTGGDFEVIESVTNKRFVWHVTDCNLHTFEDRAECKGTSVTWDLTTVNDTTTVTMAHPADLESKLATERAAVEAVRKIGSDAVPLLLPELSNSDVDVRKAVAEALCKYPVVTRIVLPALQSALSSERDGEVRGSIQIAINKLSRKPTPAGSDSV